jgi:hypothetical protein
MSNQDRAAASHLLPALQDRTLEALQSQEASEKLPSLGVCKQTPRDDEEF